MSWLCGREIWSQWVLAIRPVKFGVGCSVWIYERYASLLQRPKALMVLAGISAWAATIAAPIRKLWVFVSGCVHPQVVECIA